MSFANHPVPFASQPAASHAHGGRWSCKWRLCVCADAAPAEREPIDTDSGGNNRRALSLSSSAPTWISYKHGRSRRLFEMVMFPSLSLGCVSGCVHTLVKPATGLDRPAGEEYIRPVLSSWCSVHVAIVNSLMWIHVFSTGSRWYGREAFMNSAENGIGLWFGHWISTRSFFSNIHSAPRVSGLEMSMAFLPRNVLFVAVALWGTAHGLIGQTELEN